MAYVRAVPHLITLMAGDRNAESFKGYYSKLGIYLNPDIADLFLSHFYLRKSLSLPLLTHFEESIRCMIFVCCEITLSFILGAKLNS